MWTQNSAPIVRGPGFAVGEINYPDNVLDLWPRGDLEALGLVWVEPEPVLPSLPTRLSELAALRWERTQAFVYDGVRTQADPAIAVVNATLVMRQRRGVPAEMEQTWKLADGEFRQWDETDIETFGFAVADHIQACFDREAALTLALAADLATDLTTGWPA